MSVKRTCGIIGLIYGAVAGATLHLCAGAPIGAALILTAASAALMAALGAGLGRICE